MIPQTIPLLAVADLETFCGFTSRWGISPELGRKLQVLQDNFPTPLQIISGSRTPEQQDALRESGRPTAPNELSTHLDCPLATGADLTLNLITGNRQKIALGLAASLAGLRWGGGSQVDPETGIPQDWNHVDLGPRSVPA